MERKVGWGEGEGRQWIEAEFPHIKNPPADTSSVLHHLTAHSGTAQCQVGDMDSHPWPHPLSPAPSFSIPAQTLPTPSLHLAPYLCTPFPPRHQAGPHSGLWLLDTRRELPTSSAFFPPRKPFPSRHPFFSLTSRWWWIWVLILDFFFSSPSLFCLFFCLMRESCCNRIVLKVLLWMLPLSCGCRPHPGHGIARTCTGREESDSGWFVDICFGLIVAFDSHTWGYVSRTWFTGKLGV